MFFHVKHGTLTVLMVQFFLSNEAEHALSNTFYVYKCVVYNIHNYVPKTM